MLRRYVLAPVGVLSGAGDRGRASLISLAKIRLFRVPSKTEVRLMREKLLTNGRPEARNARYRGDMLIIKHLQQKQTWWLR